MHHYIAAVNSFSRNLQSEIDALKLKVGCILKRRRHTSGWVRGASKALAYFLAAQTRVDPCRAHFQKITLSFKPSLYFCKRCLLSVAFMHKNGHSLALFKSVIASPKLGSCHHKTKWYSREDKQLRALFEPTAHSLRLGDCACKGAWPQIEHSLNSFAEIFH
jgi:hypothetical protein